MERRGDGRNGFRDGRPHAYNPLVTAGPDTSGARDQTAVAAGPVGEAQRISAALAAGGARRDETLARLHAGLLRVARHELSRRRGLLGDVSGPELDDLATQAAGDALVSIIAKLGEFRGESRLTTWAYKFVVFEVSGKVARHRWRRQPPAESKMTFDGLPDRISASPGATAEARERIRVLSRAIREDLTERQRQVFAAVALNDVPIDELALQLGSNRNAIYKNLFDACRRLPDSLAATGYPLGDVT